MPLTAFLYLLALACFSLASAAPFSRRQTTSLFTVDFGDPGPVYYSTKKYQCPDYFVAIKGQNPPFQLVVQDVDNESTQEVGNATASWNSVQWFPERFVGQTLTLKVYDAVGNEQTSLWKWVEEGKEGPCKKKNETLWDRLDNIDRLLVIVCSLVGALFIFKCCLSCRRVPPAPPPAAGEAPRGEGEDAAGGAAAAEVGAPAQGRADEVELAPVAAPAVAPAPDALHAEGVQAAVEPPPPAYTGWERVK